jgi:hypothetical protein
MAEGGHAAHPTLACHRYGFGPVATGRAGLELHSLHDPP